MRIHTTLETADPETYNVDVETDGETVFLRLVSGTRTWESRMTAEEASNVAAVLQVAAESAAPADAADE